MNKLVFIRFIMKDLYDSIAMDQFANDWLIEMKSCAICMNALKNISCKVAINIVLLVKQVAKRSQ